MNDFFLILFKTSVFIISYIAVSGRVLKYFQRRNTSAKITDIEIIAVSAVISAIITSAAKHILKLFI